MITLGIDIGGSATKGALVDTETGKMVSERVRFETEVPVKPKEVAALAEKIRKKLGYHGIIGAGYPGVVKKGVALTAANSWRSARSRRWPFRVSYKLRSLQ